MSSNEKLKTREFSRRGLLGIGLGIGASALVGCGDKKINAQPQALPTPETSKNPEVEMSSLDVMDDTEFQKLPESIKNKWFEYTQERVSEGLESTQFFSEYTASGEILISRLPIRMASQSNTDQEIVESWDAVEQLAYAQESNGQTKDNDYGPLDYNKAAHVVTCLFSDVLGKEPSTADGLRSVLSKTAKASRLVGSPSKVMGNDWQEKSSPNKPMTAHDGTKISSREIEYVTGDFLVKATAVFVEPTKDSGLKRGYWKKCSETLVDTKKTQS